jgi:hypothetical protein
MSKYTRYDSRSSGMFSVLICNKTNLVVANWRSKYSPYIKTSGVGFWHIRRSYRTPFTEYSTYTKGSEYNSINELKRWIQEEYFEVLL